MYVSPLWLDIGDSGAGVVLGILDPLAGAGYAVLSWPAMRLAGFREINYDVSDALGIVASLVEGLSSNTFFKNAGRRAGYVMDALEAGDYLKDWLIDHNYQLEEAVYNHFNRDIWISSTRNVVDKKFEFAVNKMAQLIFEGKIEIKKAIDVFGKDAFSDYGGVIGMATWQYDPLTGKNNIFKQDDFYFFSLNDCMEGKISDYESTITNPRMRWR